MTWGYRTPGSRLPTGGRESANRRIAVCQICVCLFKNFSRILSKINEMKEVEGNNLEVWGYK